MSSAHIQQELPDCPASRLMALSRVELSIPTGVATLVFKFFSCSVPVTSKLLGRPPKTLSAAVVLSDPAGQDGAAPSVWGD